MEREIVFKTLGKGKPSLLVTVSSKQMIVGLGYENYSDWGPAFVVYIGPVRVGIGIDKEG